MNDPLPRASISPSKRQSIKAHRTKYITKVFDEVLFDTTENQFLIPDETNNYETTSFNCAFSLLSEVDLAVYINASRIVADFAGATVSREPLSDSLCMHIISKEKKRYHIFCTQPTDQFCNEFELVESTLFGNLTSSLVELAVDLGLAKFAITDYTHWIFYSLHKHDGKVILVVKSVHHESIDPTIRSALLIQLMFGKNSTRTQEELSMRRELGRFVECLKSPEASLYPRFEFGPVSMSRQKPLIEVRLLKDGPTPEGLIDLLHDNVEIMYLQKYGASSQLVSIDGTRMVLKTFANVQTWLKVLDVYTKWLSTLQGRTLPYLYAPVTSDPFRGNCRRQLGLLLEYVEGIPLSMWLQQPFIPRHLSVAEAKQLVQANCMMSLQTVHSHNVANGAVESTFMVHTLDLSVSMVDWDSARFGGTLERDNQNLKRLWFKYEN